MAISSEIEKLERRWQQTSGLVFAPLAEAYRKAGLHPRALEILEQGLALHADYGPALIVRARCHLDMGDLTLAEGAFNQALIRDPLDPIALRGLADVCERSGRLPEAIERLRALVDVDPRNSEARVLLERLLATPAPVVEPEPLPPAPEQEQSYVEPVRDQLDSLDFDVVNLSVVESLPALPEERSAVPMDEDYMVQTLATEPLEVPVVEQTPSPIQWTPAPAEAVEAIETVDAIETVEAVTAAAAAESVEPIEAIEAIEPVELPEPADAYESPMVPMAAVVADVPPPHEDVFDEFEVVEETDEVDAFEELAIAESVAAVPAVEAVDVVDVVDEVDEVDVVDVVESVEPLVEEPTVEEYASRVDVPAEIDDLVAEAELAEFAAEPVPAFAAEQAPETAPEPAPSPVLIVTESMAELFLKQGHRELGLAVYRQLLERDPGADHLRGAIARLEQELAPPAAPSAPRPASGTFAAVETGGRSVERRLQAVLHAPPPSSASTVLPPAIEPGAEPTRASGEALSLAAVFGDEPSQARREAEPAPPSSEPSYDEFFGAGPSEPTAAPSPRGEAEDLRQFNDWLKGLKR